MLFAFRSKMSFTDLASIPRLILIDQALTHRDLWCKALLSFSSRSIKWRKQSFFFLHWYPNRCMVFFGNGRISLTRIKQFVETWWWPYLFNDTSDLHHILCSLILEAQTDHVISSCKGLMRKKSIEGFVVLFVHSNVTIIHDKIWKTARSKKLLPRRKKKSLDSLLYDSNNANDKSNSPRFTIERTHIHNPWLLLVCL